MADERRRGLRRGRVGTGHCPSGADLLGELGEGVQPCRPVEDEFNLDAFIHGEGSVDLDHPVDDLDCGEPGRGRSGEFPGPVTARERAPRGTRPRAGPKIDYLHQPHARVCPGRLAVRFGVAFCVLAGAGLAAVVALLSSVFMRVPLQQRPRMAALPCRLNPISEAAEYRTADHHKQVTDQALQV